MKINRGREQDAPSERRNGTFTGEVWGDPVLARQDDVAINNVFFAPEARTHWHRHHGPQILYVISGSGRAYTRDGEGGPIGAGDVVYIPADEEHWHGADPETYLLHAAITMGGHEWLDPVTDEQYRAGAQSGVS